MHLLSSINQNKEDDLQEDGASYVLEEETSPLTKRPSLYRVLILNDDYTPMECVVFVLQNFFGMDNEKATQIMLTVHTKGIGVCGIFTKEIAETRSSQINNFAKQNGHPLITDIEEVEDEEC